MRRSETSAWLPYAWIDGRILPLGRATVPVTDSGYLHGDGLFETLRVYDGVPVFIEDHLARMRRSARDLGVRAETTLSLVPEGARALLLRCGARGCAMRINLSWEGGLVSRPEARCRVTMIAREYHPPAPTEYARGVKLIVWPWPRAAGNPAHRHKSLSYAENMAARRMAAKARAFDALFTNHRGHVAEGTATNVFLVDRGRLVTPPLEEGLLPGVTRKHLIGIAHRIGVEVRERAFGVDRLSSADEVFVANSLAEVVPVSRVEGRRVGPPGPVTRALAEAYSAEVRRAVEEARRAVREAR